MESRGHTSISSVWLGAGGTAEAEVATLRPAGPGALVLRTDGLWNHLSDAADLAAVALAISAEWLLGGRPRLGSTPVFDETVAAERPRTGGSPVSTPDYHACSKISEAGT